MAITIGQASGLAVLLLVIGVTLTVSGQVTNSMGVAMGSGDGDGNCAWDNRTDCGTDANVSYESLEGTDTFGQQMGTINIIGAAAIIISLLYGGLMLGKR